jgi:hypothetical protein
MSATPVIVFPLKNRPPVVSGIVMFRRSRKAGVLLTMFTDASPGASTLPVRRRQDVATNVDQARLGVDVAQRRRHHVARNGHIRHRINQPVRQQLRANADDFVLVERLQRRVGRRVVIELLFRIQEIGLQRVEERLLAGGERDAARLRLCITHRCRGSSC